MPTDTELHDMFARSTILRPATRQTGRPVRVRSKRSPAGILCLWDDCDKIGDARARKIVGENAAAVWGI